MAQRPGTAPAARRPRRPAGATRQRLVDAAVEVLWREGPAAVSTTRLAAEVGIVQSGFYAHFSSVGDVLAEASAKLVDEARAPVTLWMAELAATEDPGDMRVLERHFARVLDLLLPRWQAVELMLRHARDPSPFGRRMAELAASIDADVRSYLLQIVPDGRRRLPAAVDARLDLLAHLLTGLALGALEVLAEDPRQDRDAVARSLAAASHHLVSSTFDEMFDDVDARR